jgi:N-acyl-D-amino-acid deacylase
LARIGGRLELATAADHADLVIRNTRLIDGSGAPSVTGDIAVGDDRILGIGDLGETKGAVEIDGRGRAVAPGFIDVHTHDDRALLADPEMACKASQGVTTVVTGNCGISLAPLDVAAGALVPPFDLIAEVPAQAFAEFGDYLAALDGAPPALNAVCQVGHSTLRVGAMDRLDRAADRGEVAAMRRALERALDAGAAGLSTGLFYAPASAAPTEEVVALAEVLRDRGAIHTTHMRDEGDQVAESLAETFRIGAEAGVPVVISHHKVIAAPNHGRTRETLALIEAARARQPVALDVYPYVAGSTILDPKRMLGASRVLVTWSKARPDCAGRDLDEIADEMGCDPDEAARRLQPAGAIYFMMDEADVRRVLASPAAMIGSDGLPHDAHPHPRLWGTFPRVLGHYARDLGLFSLEDAVHRMTGLPAAQFGLVGRGALSPGACADLVMFDPETVIDRATYENPTRTAAGIDLVMVNGRAVWRGGAVTGARPGRALRLRDLGPKGVVPNSSDGR